MGSWIYELLVDSFGSFTPLGMRHSFQRSIWMGKICYFWKVPTLNSCKWVNSDFTCSLDIFYRRCDNVYVTLNHPKGKPSPRTVILQASFLIPVSLRSWMRKNQLSKIYIFSTTWISSFMLQNSILAELRKVVGLYGLGDQNFSNNGKEME